jgi:hypothetical protein
MARLKTSTLQADGVIQGNYSSTDLEVATVAPYARAIGLFVASTGNVRIRCLDGSEADYTAVSGFIPTPLFEAVLAAGTTSTDIIVYTLTHI